MLISTVTVRSTGLTRDSLEEPIVRNLHTVSTWISLGTESTSMHSSLVVLSSTYPSQVHITMVMMTTPSGLRHSRRMRTLLSSWQKMHIAFIIRKELSHDLLSVLLDTVVIMVLHLHSGSVTEHISVSSQHRSDIQFQRSGQRKSILRL